MTKVLLVALGGAAGAVARYLISEQTVRLLGSGWPYATLMVNVVGGLAMGLSFGWLAGLGAADQERWRLLLGVGLLGGFTTFSAFSLEMMLMLERRAYVASSIYALSSVAFSITAVFVGTWLARKLFV